MKIDFIALETVSSTNTWVKENISKLNPSHLTCITAREQTAGRGRQAKKWLSPKDANLYLTLYFTVPENASYLPNLGQLMVLSCAELLISLKIKPQIKWPNDLLVDKKKIGGVLTETLSHKSSIGVVIGLGLNVNMPQEALTQIDQPATALHLILHKQVEPTFLVQPLCDLFIPALHQLQQQGFAPFHRRFLALLAYKEELITLHLPHKEIQGICDSITSDGKLKLRLPSGEFRTFSSGEIL